MLETLQSIAKMQKTVDQLVNNIKPLAEKLQKDMTSAGIVSLAGAEAYADISRSPGKSQTTIDPKKFFAKVDEEDFFACCAIGVTKAKTVLGQKEIDRIAETVSGKLGEPVLKVKLK
jgi:hypothetical protein